MDTQRVMKQSLSRDEAFFFEQAGYSYDPKKETKTQGRIRCARELAAAEKYAKEHTNWMFSWTYDELGCSGCECGSSDCACCAETEHETLVCTVRNSDGKVLASLGGICSPGRNYSRVIEAELAEEAIAYFREEGARVNA